MIDPVDRDGETPLMLAAQFHSHAAFLGGSTRNYFYYNLDHAPLDWHFFAILNSELVRAGADVFTRNVRGKTALNMVQEDDGGCGESSSSSNEKQINQLIRRVEHILMARFNKVPCFKAFCRVYFHPFRDSTTQRDGTRWHECLYTIFYCIKSTFPYGYNMWMKK